MAVTITAQMVKELRDKTSAGMNECKKALVENDGDMQAAVEALRKAGIAKAEIRQDSAPYFSTVGRLSKDGKRFAIAHNSGDGEHANVTLISENYDTVTCAATHGHVLGLTFTDSGNLAVASTNADFFYTEVRELALDVFDEQGTLLYSREISAKVLNLAAFKLLINSHSYDGRSDIVIALDGAAYSFDEATGEQKAAITLPGMAVILNLYKDASTGFIALENGDIVFINTDTGRLYIDSTVSTGATLEDMKLLDEGIIIRSPASGSIVVLRYHSAGDLKELPELPADEIGYAVAPTSEYYVLNDRFNYAVLRFFDTNGELLYTLEDGKSTTAMGFRGNTCMAARYGGVLFINPLEDSVREAAFSDMGAASTYTRAVFSADARFLSLWGSSGIAVIDMEKETCIFKTSDYTRVSTLTLSGDGTHLLIHMTGSPVMLLDITTGAVNEWKNEALDQTAECASLPYLMSDPRGEYAAMACEDGYVRVFRFMTGQVLYTIPLQVKHRCFIGFTKDSEHLILQGDDYRVRIYRVSDGACRNSFDAPAPVAYLVEDGERIALCDNYKLNLLDAKTFGRLAFVPDGITYLAASKTFVLVDGTKAWTTKYKDYKELLAEAERHFPGAKLSEEKRMEYNIED